MLTVGIDIGFENSKAVVMKDGEVIGRACGASGGADRPIAAQAVMDKALDAAGVKASDAEKVIATGKGKFDAAMADDQVSEVIAAAAAARYFEPKVTSVVDIGADEIVVATLTEDRIKEFVLNQKCAAGLGIFLESMAERFEIDLDELGTLEGPANATVNEGCVVFAELDALSLVNRGTDVREVAMALIEACAYRANSTLNDIYKPNTDCVVLLGGLTKNHAFVKALQRISGIGFVIPEDAYYGGAIGAAALAATK
jgi:predicted CoA-substrate-specific enzyme activase